MSLDNLLRKDAGAGGGVGSRPSGDLPSQESHGVAGVLQLPPGHLQHPEEDHEAFRDDIEPEGGVLRSLPHDGGVPDERLPGLSPGHEGVAMRRSVPILLCAAVTALFLSGILPLTGRLSPGPAVSLAQEGWKAEFDAVCAKTDVAMTLSVEELKGLIVRCDQLKPKIEAEEESTRKVYLRRLQMCRELYKYVLDNK